MDKLIINMINNKKCGRMNKIFYECIAISICIAFLLGVDVFIEEVCYNTSIWEIVKKVMVFFALILLVLTKIKKYINSKNNYIALERNKKLIQVTFNAEEFKAIGMFHQHTICSYYVVGYYTEGNRTYRFDCEINDKQASVCNIFKLIHKQGVFPKKINVYVDSTNYNNYQMQVYEFFDETLKMNKELVEYEYYNVR